MHDIPLSESCLSSSKSGMRCHQYVQLEDDQGRTGNDGRRHGGAQPGHCCEQLKQPDVEDCSNGVIPYKAEPMGGKKKILVPVLTTMTKYLFDNYRLFMYTYVNRLLRNGTLSKLVGARVLNSVMNRESLSFPHVTFWRIDRTSFYADVKVELKLETQNGALVWNGYLILDDDDKRHRALGHILRVRSNDGVESANAYLERNGVDMLRI